MGKEKILYYADWTRGDTKTLIKKIDSFCGEGTAWRMKKAKRGEFAVMFNSILNKLFDKNGCRIPPIDKEKTLYYLGWTSRDTMALIRNIDSFCGEGAAWRMKNAESSELAAMFNSVLKKLFDKNGRRIPMNLQANVCHPDKRLKLIQPSMKTVKDYANRLSLISESLGVDLGITAEEFKSKTEEILSKIPGGSANIKNGIWLPLILPKFEGINIGAFLKKLLGGVNESCKKIFSNEYFLIDGELANQVKSVCHTQDELIEKMKEGPIVVVFFPNALQGFSIEAAREQIDSLPVGFIQSGIETIVAMIMYSDVLTRVFRVPDLLLSAFSWRSAECSLCFYNGSGKPFFSSTGNLSHAYSHYSAGLSFCG